MEAKDYESLKRKLCKELEEIKERKNMGMAEIEIIDKLTHAIKNINNIMEKDEGESFGYRRSYGRSYDGNENNTGRSYGDDMSYARGRHYVRGHYSYGDDVADKLADMMESSGLSLDDKSVLRRAMDVLRK